MFKKAEEFVESVFTNHTRWLIVRNFQTGIFACNQFISENSNFFSHINMCNSISDLRTYSIARQFAIEAQKDTSPYTVTTDLLGVFKYKVSFLNFDGAIATFAKTNKPNNLPSKSRYKIELSKRNNFEDKQLSLLDEIKDLPVSFELPNYCIFTYGLDGDKLSHCRIVVPNSDYTGCHVNISISESIDITKENPDVAVENIPKLKKELQQKLKLNG